MINFPFLTNGKLIILGVPILKHITVLLLKNVSCFCSAKAALIFSTKKFSVLLIKS